MLFVVCEWQGVVEAGSNGVCVIYDPFVLPHKNEMRATTTSTPAADAPRQNEMCATGAAQSRHLRMTSFDAADKVAIVAYP